MNFQSQQSNGELVVNFVNTYLCLFEGQQTIPNSLSFNEWWETEKKDRKAHNFSLKVKRKAHLTQVVLCFLDSRRISYEFSKSAEYWRISYEFCRYLFVFL